MSKSILTILTVIGLLLSMSFEIAHAQAGAKDSLGFPIVDVETVKDVFGIKVGQPFSLPDCVASSTEQLCIYPTRWTQNSYVPVHVPAEFLPKYINPRSIWMQVSEDDIVATVRYSVSETTEGVASDSQGIFNWLMQTYGGRDHLDVTETEVTQLADNQRHVSAVQARWTYPGVTIIVFLQEQANEFGGNVTVEITAQ